ncbi:MAG: glycosyltransferase family 4 protein [Planctomycetota bacterium]
MRLAYLTTKYPAVSHTFIRRELREIERRGHFVLRLAIRRADAAPVDPLDREEYTKTIHCLGEPVWRLLAGIVRTIVSRPAAFVRATFLAVQTGWRSDRALLRHLAYLVEAAYLLQLLQRNEIVHTHVHFGTNSTAVARLIRRLGGPSYSFTVHGPDEFDAPNGLDIQGKVADAAFVVAISDYCSAQLRRWSSYEDWAKIHVVRCTVGDEFLDGACSISSQSNSLVCVGRLCPQKGQMLLVEALAKIVREGVGARLVLAGDGERRSVIARRIAEAGLQDRIEITGWISEAEVRRHIIAARALVLPSFAEGLPVVIMEAFAIGRPVISTYVAGIPELVESGVNGWVIPAGNVEQLAAAMREALTMPVEHLEAMGKRGRARVRERHYLPTEVGRLEALFRQCVEGHAAVNVGRG